MLCEHISGTSSITGPKAAHIHLDSRTKCIRIQYNSKIIIIIYVYMVSLHGDCALPYNKICNITNETYKFRVKSTS